MTLLVLVVAATLLTSAVCSLLEATLYSTRITTLEAALRSEERRREAERFLAMKRDVSAPTSAILILNTIANTAGATLAGMYAAQVLGASWVPVFSLLLTFAILFFSEILPKTYGATRWPMIWPHVVWPLSLLERTLQPLTRLTQRLAAAFAGRHPHARVTEDEILAMIHLGARHGELSASELRMLDAIFRLDRVLCRQVMVPRSEVVFLDINWPPGRCFEVARRMRHTRYPVCDGSLDQVVGILHVKDLLGVAEDEADLRAFLRPVRYVPETQPLNLLLTEMQRTRQHMAVVVDEHGSTAGIVTLENVLEQIVGALRDEFDVEAPDLVVEGEGVFLARGGVPLERVNRQLGLDLRAPSVNTLSGFLIARIGRFPRVGDVVELDGLVAEVLEVEGNRASKVRLRLVPSPPAPV
jgi:CBS domain containing-hemolysin-like protein